MQNDYTDNRQERNLKSTSMVKMHPRNSSHVVSSLDLSNTKIDQEPYVPLLYKVYNITL